MLAPLALAASLSAQTWTAQPVPAVPGTTPQSVRGAAFANGRFVVVSEDRIHYSDDGVAWTASGFSAAGLRDVRALGSRFFAAAGLGLYVSDNGAIWRLAGTVPGGTPPESNDTHAFLWETDGLGGVAVRSRTVVGDGYWAGAVDIYRSDDLAVWTAGGMLPQTGPGTSAAVQSLARGSGRYVINYLVSDIGSQGPTSSITAYSTDGGATWTRSSFTGDNSALRLVYGNGWFLAVSTTGSMYRSEDGVTFRPTNSNLPTGFRTQAWFGGGLFLTYREAAPTVFYGSAEGSFWRELGPLSVTRVTTLAGLAYGHGRFLAVGHATHPFLPPQPFLLSSTQAVPPVIRRQPTATQVASGRRLRLTVGVDGAGTGVTYRWMKNGVILAEATDATLTIPVTAAADAGNYRALVTNASGTTGSDAVEVTVVPASEGGRLTNLSANAVAGTEAQQVQIGFMLSGSSPKPITIRAIGPTLGQFEVPSPLADPRLALLRNGVVQAANDNWAGDDGSNRGGFPLPAGSLDAVIPATAGPGLYSIVVSGAGTGTGRVLTELYDGDLADAANLLTNLSARGHLPPGGSLIAGFAIAGTTSLPVVIRGIGPTLADYGVPNALANPRLRLYRGQELIATNEDWLGDDGRATGAFPLPVGSPDAVLVLTLPPGVYTAHVTSAIPNQASGTALIEIYDAQ